MNLLGEVRVSNRKDLVRGYDLKDVNQRIQDLSTILQEIFSDIRKFNTSKKEVQFNLEDLLFTTSHLLALRENIEFVEDEVNKIIE